MNGSILIVDDEKGQREILTMILRKEGYDTSDVSGVSEAMELLGRQEFDLILTDLKMQGQSGLDLLEQVMAEDPQQCVIMMTAHGTVDSAVGAMKRGAFDYLEKPLERENLLLTLKRAFERITLVRENRVLQKRLTQIERIPSIIGEHPKMKEVYRIVTKIAATSSTVLIYGESGTGKELVARAIHDRSARKDQPFMAINCAAIPETLIESELFGHEKGSFTGASAREIGILEAANGGTVFLDEIGEMNVSMQAKLLRAIQEKEIRRVGGKVNLSLDVRIISATNRDLEQEIKKGAFREDLFYRLNVIRITLPPLRERGGDIATLAEFFIVKYRENTGIQVEGIAKSALKLLMNYTWPGNVRQLESVIERAVLMAEGSIIQTEDLPAEISTLGEAVMVPFELPPEGINFEEMEKALILKAMERADWVIGKAAPILGLTYKTLQYRLDKHGIEKPERRGKGMTVMTHNNPQPIDHITWNDQHIATIIRRDFMPSETTFISPDSYYQQLGFVVYPKDGVVPRHSHLPLQRHLVGTPETLLIRKGRTEVELYAMDKSPLGTWILEEGDMIQLVAGGHCFNCLEETIFLEIKQGPYTGLIEKGTVLMIPVCEPLVTARDRELVNDALISGWISSAGKYLDLFEARWAEYCGMPYGIAVSNGSTALDIAVDLLKLEVGDEVIMPTFTIISPAQSVVRAGGVPVLVDSDPITWQMDVTRIEAKITPRTKAILVVHIYGHSADMDRIMALAEKYGLMVIEDAAEVHGARYKGQPCGGIGHISTFSFYANKLVTTGEGGMVLVKDREHANHARSLRNLCFQQNRRFYHDELGYNYRMTNVQAAMGVGQIERIQETVARKREIAQAYNAAFSDRASIQLPVEMPWAHNVYWVYGIVLSDERETSAIKIMQQLREKGVETRPFFLGMHEQPVFHNMGLFQDEQYPVAERLARKGFYIPNGLALSDEQIATVVAAVKECLA